MKNNRLVAVAVACAVVMASCGGGGGDSAPPPPPPGITADISGAITKGIVVNGVVVAEELDSSANPIAVVGNAVTGSDGSYQLTLSNYTGGVIRITVTADSNTQMKCDVPSGCGDRTDTIADSDAIIDFGEFYKPSALTMTALLPAAEDGAVISASVTPFTHMAAERAQSMPVFDATAVANANSEVSNLLGGLDILNTTPVDITDPAAVGDALSPTQITYAALLSSVATIADKDATTGQPKLNDVLSQLATAFTSGAMLADDGTGAQLSLQAIVTGAGEAFTQIGMMDVTGVLSQLQQDINTAGVGGTIDPEPSPTVADSNLDKVKAMMSDVRTWGNVIETETEAQSNAFSSEIDMASSAAEVIGGGALDAFASGLEAALEFDGITTDLTAYGLGFDSGTVSSPTPGTIQVAAGVVNGYTVNMTVALPADGTTASAFTLGVESATVAGTPSSLTVTGGTVNVVLASPYTIDYALPATLPMLTDLVIDLDASFTQKVDSSGVALQSPVTFAGALQSNLDPITITNSASPDDYLALPKTLSLTGEISDTQGNSFSASFVANVTNTASFEFVGDFAPVGTLYSANHTEPFVSWSYSDIDTTTGDDTFTFAYPGYWASVYWDATTNTSYLSSSYYGTTLPANSLNEAISSFMSYFGIGSSDINAWVEGEGVYQASVAGADFSMDGTLDGSLTEPDFVIENANQWIDADFGLTFEAQFAGLPLASVNITADRTAFASGNGTVTLAYGQRQIAIAVTDYTSDDVNPTTMGSVTITNQDGAVVVLDNIVLSSGVYNGVVTYNGNQYGTVETTPSGFIKVTYIDGTFEIF